jgi:hypothetical protein
MNRERERDLNHPRAQHHAKRFRKNTILKHAAKGHKEPMSPISSVKPQKIRPAPGPRRERLPERSDRGIEEQSHAIGRNDRRTNDLARKVSDPHRPKLVPAIEADPA